MSNHVAVLRTRYGRAIPIAGDEVKALAGKLPNVRTEPCRSKDGELDLVILRDEAPVHRFVLEQGELRTGNPTHEELQVLINIAGQLAARVRSDEFETFRTPTATYIHPDDTDAIERARAAARRLRRVARLSQWIRSGLMLFLSAVAGLAVFFSRRPKT